MFMNPTHPSKKIPQENRSPGGFLQLAERAGLSATSMYVIDSKQIKALKANNEVKT
jgi:hypothetical protein